MRAFLTGYARAVGGVGCVLLVAALFFGLVRQLTEHLLVTSTGASADLAAKRRP